MLYLINSSKNPHHRRQHAYNIVSIRVKFLHNNSRHIGFIVRMTAEGLYRWISHDILIAGDTYRFFEAYR